MSATSLYEAEKYFQGTEGDELCEEMHSSAWHEGRSGLEFMLINWLAVKQWLASISHLFIN